MEFVMRSFKVTKPVVGGVLAANGHPQMVQTDLLHMYIDMVKGRAEPILSPDSLVMETPSSIVKGTK